MAEPTVPGTTEPAAPVRPPPPARPAESWGARAGRRLRNFMILAVVVAIALAALYVFVALNWNYSSGERAGYVQKFSRKGWVCKTWEGELAMVNLPGAMPEIFKFSVRDDAVAAQVNNTLGSRVVLSYGQHLGLPSCFAETEYWVKTVRGVTP
jgi:hypothetical protein